jgi:hypothetical protein
MTVEILPPLPGKGRSAKSRPDGARDGFAYGSPFTIVRVPPLLAGLLVLPFLLILLPILLLASLVFGFRLWRRMAMLSGLMARGGPVQGADQNTAPRILGE